MDTLWHSLGWLLNSVKFSEIMRSDKAKVGALLTLRESGDHPDSQGHRGTSEAAPLLALFPGHQQVMGRAQDLLLVRAAGCRRQEQVLIH